MKAILMSIRPKWCEKIFSGEKTIEVRKTAPKETPFKVYVYCTKERMTSVPSIYAYLHKNEPRACAEYGTIETWGEIGDVIVNPHLASKHVSFGMHGKVVGEFVCDMIEEFKKSEHGVKFNRFRALYETRLSVTEMREYMGNQDKVLGLHITEPKLYDTPKELGEFLRVCPKVQPCENCKHSINDEDVFGTVSIGCDRRIIRPPQSWCYVEERENGTQRRTHDK